jgi:hypothetical protein
LLEAAILPKDRHRLHRLLAVEAVAGSKGE